MYCSVISISKPSLKEISSYVHVWTHAKAFQAASELVVTFLDCRHLDLNKYQNVNRRLLLQHRIKFNTDWFRSVQNDSNRFSFSWKWYKMVEIKDAYDTYKRIWMQNLCIMSNLKVLPHSMAEQTDYSWPAGWTDKHDWLCRSIHYSYGSIQRLACLLKCTNSILEFVKVWQENKIEITITQLCFSICVKRYILSSL